MDAARTNKLSLADFGIVSILNLTLPPTGEGHGVARILVQWDVRLSPYHHLNPLELASNQCIALESAIDSIELEALGSNLQNSIITLALREVIIRFKKVNVDRETTC
jgi:hypothetical protein